MKTSLSMKEWVCLVSLEEIKQANERQKNTWAWPYPLREKFWREIRVNITPKEVEFTLMNVDEEAATGGYWRGGDHCQHYKFKWGDFCDETLLIKTFAREELQVWRVIDKMINRLHVKETEIISLFKESDNEGS